MNIKISCHIMPWDIDYALLVFDKFKQSSYFINSEDKIYIDSCLNLSHAIIDWDKSTLPKEFFIEKYKVLDTLISNVFIHKPFIYDQDGVYGHLDSQKEVIEPHIDYYIGMCPDLNFSEHLLYYMIESAKQIKQEYFIITPQIFKSWDSSWDILVNDIFSDVNYEDCLSTDIHEIRHKSLDLNSPTLIPISQFKFAGWFDLYNKALYEKLIPTLEEWKGYGPWDLYAMNVCNIAHSKGVDVKQFMLKDQIIWFQDTGCWKNEEEYGGDGKLRLIYKNFLPMKLGRQEQRSHIDNNLNKYLMDWIEYAKQNNIIK
jgi:hypothetical protein